MNGSKEQIKELQRYLNEMGYTNVKVDGIYGPITQSAYEDLLGGGIPKSSGNPTLDLQREMNANGYKLEEDGIWGPKTKAAYTDYLTKSVSSNPDLQEIMATNSPERIAAAYLNNDWTGVVDSMGMPFSQEQQEEAFRKGEKDVAPYYKEMGDYEKQNVEDILRQKQLDYQAFLDKQKASFEEEKATQDKTAADSGVLFSGGRYQKLKNLKDTYQKAEDYERASTGNIISGTARDYQYKYGDKAAGKLSNYYKIGGNVYNPDVATGGVTSSSLSRVYNPSSSSFTGTKVSEQKSEAQKRAAGLLWNKGNKLVPSGYGNKY